MLRYTLRTLLIVLAIGPMVLAGGYWAWAWPCPITLPFSGIGPASPEIFAPMTSETEIEVRDGYGYDPKGKVIFRVDPSPPDSNYDTTPD